MIAVAKRLIAEHGAAKLSFRSLAKDPELQVSHSAPLHHFGTNAGLLGAVAGEAFQEIAQALRRRRKPRSPTVQGLVQLAEELAAYGVANPRLYQAIHSPELWEAATGTDVAAASRQNPPGRAARDRAALWVQGAVKGRNAVFGEFIRAAEELLWPAPDEGDPDPEDVARVMTTIVDGYLFQLWNEMVAPSPDPASEVGRLAHLALRGLGRRTD